MYLRLVLRAILSTADASLTGAQIVSATTIARASDFPDLDGPDDANRRVALNPPGITPTAASPDSSVSSGPKGQLPPKKRKVPPKDSMVAPVSRMIIIPLVDWVCIEGVSVAFAGGGLLVSLEY